MDLILGATGKLGSQMAKLMPDAVALDRHDLDVTDRQSVNRLIERKGPANVINCTGFTDVDACETEAGECWKVNVYAVENLLEACEKVDARLVHFSSDYTVDAVNEYARSKLVAEKIVEKYGLVIRTNFYTPDTFILRKLLGTDEPVPAFSDLVYNPISIYSLADESVKLIGTDKRGTYNVATKKPITPFEFAGVVCDEFGLDRSRIEKASARSLAVPRPRNSFIEPYNSLLIEDDIRRFHELGKVPKQQQDTHNCTPP